MDNRMDGWIDGSNLLQAFHILEVEPDVEQTKVGVDELKLQNRDETHTRSVFSLLPHIM